MKSIVKEFLFTGSREPYAVIAGPQYDVHSALLSQKITQKVQCSQKTQKRQKAKQEDCKTVGGKPESLATHDTAQDLNYHSAIEKKKWQSD
jgi:hypothetical protein